MRKGTHFVQNYTRKQKTLLGWKLDTYFRACPEVENIADEYLTH